MLCGCIYDDPEPCRRCDDISVTLSVRSDKVETLTRTTDEDAVSDVNLYLFGRNSFATQHVYSASDILTFKCAPGEYEVFVLANMHADLGEMTAMQLEEYDLEQRDFDVSLPMTARTELRIASGVSSLTLPPLEVRRAVAKVSCNISVLPEDMELLSAQLLSVPRTSRPFDAAARPSSAADDYTDTDVVPLGGRQASVEYYLLPNAQGENTAITDPRQKDAAHAPAHASFLRLRARRGNRILTYAVYLGENTTTNFDELANRHYRLNISILGDRDIDTRMSAYTVRVWDDFDDYNYGGYCLLNGTRYLHIDVECYDGTAPVRGHLKVLSGDTRSFAFNYGDTGPSHDFDIYDMTGDNEYEMEYYVAGYNDTNALLAYRVILTDAYGFTRSYDFEHRMANAVCVETTGIGTFQPWRRSTSNPMRAAGRIARSCSSLRPVCSWRPRLRRA